MNLIWVSEYLASLNKWLWTLKQKIKMNDEYKLINLFITIMIKVFVTAQAIKAD